MMMEPAKYCDQGEKEEQCWVLGHRVLEEMQGQTDDSKHHMLLLHQCWLVQSKQQLWPLDIF